MITRVLGISTAVLIVLCAILGYFLKESYKTNGNLTASLETAAKSIKAMKDGKKITEEVGYDLEIANSALRSRIDRMLKEPAKCIPIQPGNSVRHNEAGGRTESSGSVGIGERTVIRLLGRGDEYRNQVIACQSFLRRTEALYNE